MSGRTYFALAIFALIALAPSLGWALALLGGWRVLDPQWQYAAFPLPFVIIMLAVRPRDRGETLLSGAAVGLHRSSRRAALASCFAPYRPRTPLRALRRPGAARVMVPSLLLFGLAFASGLILPAACFLAFLFALRRAAWLGQPDAILLEWDWLRVRGPIAPSPGHRLAAAARAR